MDTGTIAAIGETQQASVQSQVQDNSIYSIHIRQLSYGYVVEVGCKCLAIESATQLVSLFSQYILNPKETEKRFIDGSLFKPTAS